MDTKKNNLSKIIGVVIAFIIVGGGTFYGGMQYANAQKKSGGLGISNMTPGQRQARFGGAGGARSGGAGSFTAGDIISNDGKSITVKLRDGGSKIVFLGDKTEVLKSVNGASSDLTVGSQVTVSGKPNSDGSLNADTVQIRLVSPATNASDNTQK